MRKWKTGLMILAILLVAATGAVLPLFCHPDTAPDEAYSFVSMPDYTMMTDRKPLTLSEKLELLQFDGQRISVLPDRMKHSEKEIIEAVKEEFERYADKGILSAALCDKIKSYTDTESLPDRPHSVKSATWPTMIFSMETGEKFDYFWEVRLSIENNSEKTNLFCIVDDETMKILTVRLHSMKQAILQEPVPDSVYRFAEAYFEHLGIVNAQEYKTVSDSIVYKVPTKDGSGILVDFHGGYGSLSRFFDIYILSANKH